MSGVDGEDRETELGDKMSLLDHLTELRQRLLYSVIALVVCFFGCFFFASEIFNFLVAPLADIWADQPNRRLIFTALHEKFFTEIKVAFFAAACVAFPVIASQIWMFIAPGLYKNEKAAFLPFLLATPVLFTAGAASVYYGVMPVAWQFFAGFEQLGTDGQLAIELEPKVNEYLSLVMQLIFAFGLAFQLPVLLTLLARVGIIDCAWLKSKRRYAIVFAFIAAAVLTPPDPLSQVGLAVPIILLYEVSIWIAAMFERNQAKAAA
ncbi:MAG: twin-arginine translocase subunit TatC [Alphaproteobacteria bacterium]|nr:twin-arginine translocase subunit TatC [Alphaproteobacteria bacterium SS10]